MKRKNKKMVMRIHNVLLEKKFEGAYINKVYLEDEVVHCNIHLPEQKDINDLIKVLPNLQQEVGATAAKLGKVSGKYVEILFGMRNLEHVDFSTDMLIPGTLKVQFPSAYGEHILDFEDGASCHLLNGGVTRMGKTCFLLHTATSIFLQNNGNIKMYISSAKLKDYYPFEGIPNVRMSMDVPGMMTMLDEIVEEYNIRNKLLYTPELRKATDAKSIRKLYPEHYHMFKPIFLIIDEYARFADSREIQSKVTEIVETAGFVNVHVIIASQRPDASNVLKPRIRANLLARMAFTTADKKNSEIILDREGAERLGRVPGRGLLVDSDSHIIQVPYLDVLECDKLLSSYQTGGIENEQTTEGCTNNGYAEQVQSMQQEPPSVDSLPGQCEPRKCSQPCTQEDVINWSDFTNPEGT